MYKCFVTKDHKSIIKLRKAVYEKSNPLTNRQSKVILPPISAWPNTCAGATQDTYANLAKDYRSAQPIEDDIHHLIVTYIVYIVIVDPTQDAKLPPVPVVQATTVPVSIPTPAPTVKSSTRSGQIYSTIIIHSCKQ